MKRKINENQGFTLVELLTTILILSILTVLAIVGVRTILENAKKSYYSSQSKTLVLAGQSYVGDNRNALPKTLGRSTKIPLKKLKEQNYIKEVLDYSKKICDLEKSYVKVYKYSKDKYSYMAYLDCPSYTSKEETYANGPTIVIDFKSAYDVAKADLTITDPDKVISYSYIAYKDGSEIKNSGNVDAKQQKEVKKSISLKEYVPGKIKLAVIATDMYGNVSTKTVTEDIKDTIPPTCGSITGASTSWTNTNRKITITCSDTGSGCTRGDYTKTFKTSTKVGNITIKDKAGNEKSCPVNAYVDKDKPSCANSGGNAAWTNGNRTLTGTCSDSGGSGCKGNVSLTFSSNTNTTTASPGTVYDNAGNSTTCPSNQTVRIDKTAPSCTNSGGNAAWTNGNRTLTGSCSDAGGSGCKGNVTKTFSSNINTTTAGPGTVYDNAGNAVTCPNNQTVRIDKTAPSCSSSGGNGSWTNGNRTLTGSCSDSGGSGCRGNASTTYSSNINTTTAGPGTVYDNAGNAVTCPNNQTVRIDKTAPSCSSSGGSTAWTSGSRTLVGTCSDSLSGCRGNVYWTIDWDGNWSNLSPGTVYDNVGNATTCPANQTVRINKKPTKPTINLNGYSSGSWTNQTVTITANSTSTIGIDHYIYSHDNVNWSNDFEANPVGWSRTFNGNRSSMSVKLGWDGQFNFYIRSVDKNGNVSDSSDMFTLRVDKTAPGLDYALINDVTGVGHANGTWSRNGIFRRLYPSDGGSGVDIVQYNTGSSWYTEGNVANWWVGEGRTSAQFRVRDKAGNYSYPITLNIMVDWTPPVYTSVFPACGDPSGTGKRAYVALYFADSISGLGYRNTYDWDCGGNTIYFPDLNYGGAGSAGDLLATNCNWLGFHHYVCDNAGNCSSWDDSYVTFNC